MQFPIGESGLIIPEDERIYHQNPDDREKNTCEYS